VINKNSLIFVTGHQGLVGSSVVRRLKFYGYKNLIYRSKKQLDLLSQSKVLNFFKKNKIDAVINAAGKVGGINANNKYKANFIYENIAIQNNIIHSSYENNVKSLIFLGSSCIYPRNSKQPIKEEYLLTGKLEKTNEPYAIAKIAGIKMCESYNFQYKTNYKCLMPCNLYGPNDNYNLENSHFLPALISKIHSAKIRKKKYLNIWGTGKPKREFLFVDDLAKACVYIMSLDRKKYSQITHSTKGHINIGYGEDLTINDLALKIKKIVDYKGRIEYDKTKPDGMTSKLLNSHKINSLGWKPEITLDMGLIKTYSDFLKKNKL